MTKGAVNLLPDSLVLDSKTATQAQLRIYLYTKDEHTTPSVSLVGGQRASGRCDPRGRAAHQRTPAPDALCRCAARPGAAARYGPCHLPGQSDQPLGRRYPARRICPLAMRDCRSTDAERNLSFAAAAAGCWGFPCWACWGNLALLRSEVRAGYGVIVGLESTPAQQAAGMPPLRYAALRGLSPGGTTCRPVGGSLCRSGRF